jgi:hypothetical protein
MLREHTHPVISLTASSPTWVTAPPTFPPDPTKPLTRPVLRFDTKGTMPKLRPQLCWQKIEKMTRMAMVAPRLLLVRPIIRQKTPPRV